MQKKGRDIHPQQAQQTLHILTTAHHNCFSSITIIHLPLSFQYSHATMNDLHFPSHSNSRQLQPFRKTSHHLFITCYLSPTAHAKIQLFPDTSLVVLNTILVLIKQSSSPRHYQHDFTIIHCLEHCKFFVSTSPNTLSAFFLLFFYMFLAFIFFTPVF